MLDRDISLNLTTACMLWTSGVALIAIALVLRTVPELSALGVVVACAGATLNVRGFVMEALRDQREAFEIGRDYEAGGKVRRMR